MPRRKPTSRTWHLNGENGSGMSDQWDAWYRHETPPWDVGRAQAAFVRLAEAGEIESPVLDSGCGTGENTLMLATRGYEALGVDIAPFAIETARLKAADRNLTVEFEVGDILRLDRLGRTFRTVVDSAAFHVFDDKDRARYVTSLAAAVEPGGVVHLLCFSELTPGQAGPRRVTQAELRAAFADGWTVERIDRERFEVNPDFMADKPYAWLAKIVRH